MTPSFVFKKGKDNKNLFLVTGTPGGSRIITTTLQIILNVIDHQMNIASATHAPRIHHLWLPDEIRYERELGADTIKLLQNKGHKLAPHPTMGSAQSILIIDKELFGASDPRTPTGNVAGF